MPTRTDVDNAAPSQVVVARTPFGKGINLHRVPNTSMFELKMDSGALPAVLQGRFTGLAEAKKALAQYENARPPEHGQKALAEREERKAQEQQKPQGKTNRK